MHRSLLVLALICAVAGAGVVLADQQSQPIGRTTIARVPAGAVAKHVPGKVDLVAKGLGPAQMPATTAPAAGSAPKNQSDADKAQLFQSAAELIGGKPMATLPGVLTKAVLTPAKPFIANQASISEIAFGQVYGASVKSPGDGSIRFSGVSESEWLLIDFIPGKVGQPHLVSLNLNVDTQIRLLLSANGHTAITELGSGPQTLTALVVPESTAPVSVMLRSGNNQPGKLWFFHSAEITVMK